MLARSLLLGVLSLSLPLNAWGWGEDGHVIVSRIAEAHLKPAARAAVKELLDDRSFSDVRICTWADQIRRSAVYDRKYKNHPLWHYINLELKVEEADFKPAEDNDHVLGAIERFRKVLADRQATKEDRKEALMFVVHFMEDFHQPLHTCHRAGDRGGNLQPIKSFLGGVEEKSNLHKIWDVDLVKAIRGDLNNDDFAKRLLEEIKDDDRKKWGEGDVKKWIWESHQIGVKTVYKFTDGADLPKPKAETAAELTEENYVKEKRPIVREQIKKAGVRLAQVLNETFEEKK